MYLIQLIYKRHGILASPKEWQNMAREAYATMGRYWFEHFREKHFTKEGAAEYGYLPRAGEQAGIGSKGFFQSYTGRKQRKFGHTDPLVWSGESRNASRAARIVVTAYGCKVRMNMPRLNWQNPNSKIKPREEMERISNAEARTLKTVGQTALDSFIQRYRGSTVTKTIRT